MNTYFLLLCSANIQNKKIKINHFCV